MAPIQQGIIHSDLRRKKRRMMSKMLQAEARIRDALFALENTANELSIAYERAGDRESQVKANAVVNSLRTKKLFTVDGLSLLDDLLPSFNNLPED